MEDQEAAVEAHRKAAMEYSPGRKQTCNDPRCDEHGDFTTSYRNPMPDDVCTDLHKDGSVTVYSAQNRRLSVEACAETHSCTGPVTMTLQVPRDVVHEVLLGAETLTITLAEAVE